MKTKIASCLLALAFVTGCETTKTAKNGTLEERMTRIASADSATEPAPPAEGPDDVPADGTIDVNRNPGLVPTRLLRNSAASDTP
jgi:hypothetical protein